MADVYLIEESYWEFELDNDMILLKTNKVYKRFRYRQLDVVKQQFEENLA